MLCMIAGLYLGLVVAPADYQQGESYRIMYVHVPAAWMSLFIYVVMAGAGSMGRVVAGVLRRLGLPGVAIELDQHRLETCRDAGF